MYFVLFIRTDLDPKISKPLCKLLEKDVPFEFSSDCVDVFDTIKDNLISTSIITTPDWKMSFELMCDANDFTVGAVLGQRKIKIDPPRP